MAVAVTPTSRFLHRVLILGSRSPRGVYSLSTTQSIGRTCMGEISHNPHKSECFLLRPGRSVFDRLRLAHNNGTFRLFLDQDRWIRTVRVRFRSAWRRLLLSRALPSGLCLLRTPDIRKTPVRSGRFCTLPSSESSSQLSSCPTRGAVAYCVLPCLTRVQQYVVGYVSGTLNACQRGCDFVLEDFTCRVYTKQQSLVTVQVRSERRYIAGLRIQLCAGGSPCLGLALRTLWIHSGFVTLHLPWGSGSVLELWRHLLCA